VKEVLTQLILGSHPSQAVPQSPAQPTVAVAAPTDIPAQLQQLAGLHAAGILSDVEFSQKKAELLSRM
jgi:hypothetical protein